MTAIVYHNGQLIADRRNIYTGTPMCPVDAGKIFVSQDGQFAYGIAGKGVSPTQRDKAEHALRHVISTMMVSGADAQHLAEITDYPLEQGIVVTKTMAFSLIEFMEMQVRVNPGITVGCGSGGMIVALMLRMGKTIKEAESAIRRHDPMTGDQFDVIKVKSLKPFVIAKSK